MSSLFEDSKVRYTREGRAEGRIEGRMEGDLDIVIRTATKLVREGVMDLEQALEFMDIPEGYEDHVRAEVIKNLSSQD